MFERTQSRLVLFLVNFLGQKANYKWRSYQADRPLVNFIPWGVTNWYFFCEFTKCWHYKTQNMLKRQINIPLLICVCYLNAFNNVFCHKTVNYKSRSMIGAPGGGGVKLIIQQIYVPKSCSGSWPGIYINLIII